MSSAFGANGKSLLMIAVASSRLDRGKGMPANTSVANHLKQHLRHTVETLLARGMSQREVAKTAGVNRRTVRAIQKSKCSGVADELKGVATQSAPPQKISASNCRPYHDVIEKLLAVGRNATAIYQDLTVDHGYNGHYNSVKRYVRKLRQKDPQRFDKLEFLPGEECQVDYGQGAPTRIKNGSYKKPYLFCMTLKSSGKCFRKVTQTTNQETWARLHEEAFRHFGGVPKYVVLDNLKEGVITPDIYEPKLNPVYEAMLVHYGTVGDPCRVRDPNRKGSVENAVKHAQNTPLKGKKFESVEDQNKYLADWESRWADTRIHGTKKRVVLELFAEEKPHLLRLPSERFQFFKESTRTVDDYGTVVVEGSNYSASLAALHSQVLVRVYDSHIQIFSPDRTLLHTHQKSQRKGAFVMPEDERMFNPSRDVKRMLEKVAGIGPSAEKLGRKFAQLGRPGHRQLYGLSNLLRSHDRGEIESVAELALSSDTFSYESVVRALEQRAKREEARPPLTQVAPEIRKVAEYQDYFNKHTQEVSTNGDDKS